MSIPVAVGVILGALLLFVLVSMYLEQDGQVSQRLILDDAARLLDRAAAPSEPTTDEPAETAVRTGVALVAPIGAEPPGDGATPEVPAEVGRPERVAAQAPPAVGPRGAPESTPEREPELDPAPEPAPERRPEPVPASEPVVAPAAGLRWGAVTTGASSVSLRDADVVDTISGVLFGAYVASGGAAAKRVSGWVTVRATPPSLDAEQFPPGADLRGKVGRVARILDCDDLDATWVALQPRVDIARGLTRAPVTDPVLEGLLTWWRAARSLPTVLSAAEAGELASAIAAVEERLADHPWSEAVARLRAALVDGVVNDREVLLGIAGRDEVADGRDVGAVPADDGTAGDDRPDDRPLTPGETPSPSPTAPRS